jgi:hypothetical protein
MDTNELILRYLNAEATPAEILELDRRLAVDPAARRRLLAEVGVDTDLREIARERATSPVPIPSCAPVSMRYSVQGRAWAIAVAAAFLLTALLAGWFPSQSREIGTVTKASHIRVTNGMAELAVGQRLTPGRIALESGMLEIFLSNGVRLLQEGPGELELISPMRTLLHNGQVVVRVPSKAVGFQLDAPSVRVVDFGTEFAVKTGPGLVTDVQVFEGVVEASPAQGGFASRLEAGRAARFTPASMSAKELPYLKSRFIRHIPLEPGIPLPGNGAEDQFRRALHAEVVIPPVDRKIHVDGDLAEWGDEGSFFSRRDAERSVEGRMRYDADAFYIGAHIADPAPMRNSIDPFMDGELGWRGGGLQVRLSLDRTHGWPVDANSPGYYRSRHITATPEQIARAENERLVTLTLWHHAPTSTDCLHLAFGFDYSGGQVNPPGYTSVFKRDADGAGYTIEARVPWSLLRAEKDPPRAGDELAVCWHAHWSDPTGRVWQANLVELRNPSEPLRILDFERAASWGRAVYR